MRQLYAFLLIMVLSLLPAGVLAAQQKVFVSILPQATFVKQLGGDLVSVEVMVKPGASPATYEPKPRQMAQLSEASLYLAIGVPFEAAWLERFAAANPKMRVVHTEEGIEKRPMAAHHHEHEGEHEKGHAEKHEHGHGILDPHVWLAPSLVKIQARSIANALIQAAPKHKAQFESNLQAFLEKCDQLDARLKGIFKDVSGEKQFMVFHPSWGYFAQDYGLKQVPIEMEGKEPSPAELEELIEHARHDGIKVIFAQPQFSEKSAKAIAEAIGGKVVKLDPLAENWSENLVNAAEIIREALR